MRYQIPSDKFTDIGDGHTDVYQIYIHENDEETFLGFMIDSGYQEISKEGIRERWEKVYGELEDYKFKKDGSGSVTYVADGEKEGILNRYEYDAWGNLTTCEEKVQNRFKFNGQRYDPVSQQYYLRA